MAPSDDHSGEGREGLNRPARLPNWPGDLSRRRTEPLELLAIEGLPEAAVPAFEAALQTVCATVAYVRDEPTDTWRIEGVREAGAKEEELTGALALAALVAGIEPPALQAAPIEAEGWLARTVESFSEFGIGRFVIRPTHAANPWTPGRVVLRLDAGLAFGSGEHASTQGCLMALAGMAHRKPRQVLDLGTGSAILALAAAKLLKRPVLATDIEPWSVRIAGENAKLNGYGKLIRAALADGWRHRLLRGRQFDLVFANILARPLCAMARPLSLHLAPGGTAILAGLLGTQARMVLAAHRRQGLVLERRLDVGPWTTLVLRRR
ncbi:50S ribosomal protein L11 methyltransferase [Siccirubricoccus sp. KC 17139]|uniref:Ribosomal protein L11 methyltransferase n=1 Tax=Siccirubricoccus soli TaxID=2899147 RepID=A0ABT1D024_9PROT|nr:50S ribosomal protein L11 methyltransferase [Siccirubricoccus soli]MCO6415265.1 50S ribosomal protein L11 methyltransferase [Siccirubricoccus soli]MCP2681396.1 50S ribosomal protein L11 methyltransferase [Siccirubricoccus soli]